LGECAQYVLEHYGPDVMQYGAGAGFEPLVEYLAEQAGVNPKRVIVGQGSLLLQDFIARSLLGPGEVAYVENPTYDRTILTMLRPGSEVRGITMQPDGMDVDQLASDLLKGEKPALVYTIPDFQNPTGIVLSLEKRERLASLAERYGFWIIEDVPYRKLRYSGEELPTLFDLAPQRVMQMSSFSKLIGPGLRVGYVILPDALSAGLLRFVEETYICPTYLVQGMVYDFIRRGWLTENVVALKAMYPPRLQAMLAALDEHMGSLASWTRPEGGFFVGVHLKGDVQQSDLLKRASAAGLALTDGRDFYTNDGGENFIRLPFCALTPEQIFTGVERLASVAKELLA
jgi:DNA-binding transcriptional MocR family regulator